MKADWGELSRKLNSPVYVQEVMSRHTSWKVGGPAQFLVDLSQEEDLKTIFDFIAEYQLKWRVIGLGTNLLVSDQGLEGIVIKIGSNFSGVKVAGELLTVKAGTSTGHLLKAAREAGLGGLEFLAGIPGSLGGIVAMNAGAMGKSIGEVAEQVRCLNANGQLEEWRPEDLDFSYRHSRLLNSGRIVLEVVLRGSLAEPELIAGQIKQNLAKRKKAHPLEYPNAGSVFKNPPGDYAGRLIEACGCKGLRVGGAEVSQKHANFIINRDGATAEDIWQLIELVQEKVYGEFGIKLTVEVQLAGSVEKKSGGKTIGQISD
ncbi:MAG: UDP-N-acetylmuramate dehydrogenase [Clostridia bacterium]|nr:UDP-N-acetylmuramate dehydrogenase [Clostridia bacterium]